jgi:hypothetical protein
MKGYGRLPNKDYEQTTLVMIRFGMLIDAIDQLCPAYATAQPAARTSLSTGTSQRFASEHSKTSSSGVVYTYNSSSTKMTHLSLTHVRHDKRLHEL